ncbi:MAG TPA: MFS transporter [Anaeromyxobacter sp.]|nr:MFS transporter [Anaeromyxobacter sp.]
MKPIHAGPLAAPVVEAMSAGRAPWSRWTLAGLCLSMLMSSLDTSIAAAALPTLARAYGASFQDVQWVVLSYLLAITTLIVGVGRLGDIVGRRRLLLAGILLFTAASALCGGAPNLWVLVIARALQGLGAAAMMALTVAFVGDAVPRERTGSAMGLLGTMSAVGTALGPSLGGALVAAVGWRAIFLVNVPLGLVNLLLARRHLPADPLAAARERPRFDWLGMVLLAGTLGPYALAMTLPGSFDARNTALLTSAALCAVLFVRAEATAPSPLVRLAIFRERVFGAGLAMSALVSTVIMATLVVGPFHLTRTLGLDAARAGLVLSAGPVVAALTGVPAGRVVDWMGTRRTTLAGLGAMALGSSLLSAIPAALGVAGYVGPITVLTAGYALFQAANNTAVMAAGGADRRGLTSGVLTLSRNLGLVTGASLMGAVFARAAGTADLASAPPGDVATGTQVTFAVAAGLVGVAAALNGLRSTPPRR